MRNLSYLSLLFFLVLCLQFLVSDVSAQETPAAPKLPNRAAFLIGGALELGGEAVAVVSFQDGSTQKVNAGQGGSFFVGGEWLLDREKRWALRATLGIKYVTTKATNANITLTRIPVRVTGIYHLGKKWWLGAGAVTHQAIRFKAGGIGQNLSFKSAFGPTFEFGYSAISFIYTPMTYKDESGQSYRAGAAGLAFNFPIRNQKKRN